MTTTLSMLDETLAYAAHGWHVIALHTPQSDGSCSCGNTQCGNNIGKHPRYDRQLLPNGLKNATADPGIIAVWWALWTDANIGIATGAVSGFWALDIDPDKGGDLSLEALLVQHGPLPETPEARTGGGGRHILFAHPGIPIRNRASFAPGLDTRGDGGYIVAAPSLHASGRCYEWLISPDDVLLASAPQWLLDLVIRPAPMPANAAQANGHVPLTSLPKRTLHYLAFGASNGTRNAELYAAAQQFYASGYSQSEADRHLRSRAQQDGLDDQEISRTIASAYQSVHVSGPAAVPGTAAGNTSSNTNNTTPAAGAPATPPPATAVNRQQRQHSAFIAAALSQLGYTFRLNRCNDTIEVNGQPMTDVIAAHIRTDARDGGIRPLAAVEDVLMVEASRNSYHPIHDYLNSLVWDGNQHIGPLASALQCGDPPITYPDGTVIPLVNVYLWRWLIGAAAKALDGHQNLMLVLAGPQGIGKSSFVRWLCSGLPDYFIEGPINVADKDTDVRLISYFLWEVSELGATTRKADVDAIKAFITKAKVNVRKAYGRHDTVKLALANLIGTINESVGFLTDETGNRRFLTVRIDAIDWAYLNRADVHQVWAEAVARYRAGEPWQLSALEMRVQTEQNRTHEVETLLEGWLEKYFIVGPGAGTNRMTAAEIVDVLRECYDIRLNGSGKALAMELSQVLRRFGAKRVRNNNWRGYEGIMPK